MTITENGEKSWKQFPTEVELGTIHIVCKVVHRTVCKAQYLHEWQRRFTQFKKGMWRSLTCENPVLTNDVVQTIFHWAFSFFPGDPFLRKIFLSCFLTVTVFSNRVAGAVFDGLWLFPRIFIDSWFSKRLHWPRVKFVQYYPLVSIFQFFSTESTLSCS